MILSDLQSWRVRNVAKTVDDRSHMAKSLSKVSEIIAISMLMIVPGLIGYLIDQKVGSQIVFTLLGLGLGMTGAVMQLVRLVSSPSRPDVDSSHADDSSERE